MIRLLLYVTILNLMALNIFSKENQKPSNHQVLLLNGGDDIHSNFPRYFNNIKSMYESFRKIGVESSDINVLYSGGKAEDTTLPPTNVYHISTTETVTETVIETATPTAVNIYNNKNLFNGEEREIDGAATKINLTKKLTELKQKLGDQEGNLTLFITDHGALSEIDDETTIVLWGEKITVSELNEVLKTFNPKTKIRIISNICYGGGLSELSSSNVCVITNQIPTRSSYSENDDLDIYAQSFAFAIKHKIDWDKDGKVTYLDAHQYASSLDDGQNLPKTSLEKFLKENQNKFTRNPKSNDCFGICKIPVMTEITQLEELFGDIQTIAQLADISIYASDDIPKDRLKYYKGRVEKLVATYLDDPKMQNLDIRIQSLNDKLLKLETEWDRLSPEEQSSRTQTVTVEAAGLKATLAKFEASRYKMNYLSRELNFLKYANKELFNEYLKVRECLEYEY